MRCPICSGTQFRFIQTPETVFDPAVCLNCGAVPAICNGQYYLHSGRRLGYNDCERCGERSASMQTHALMTRETPNI